MSTPITGRMTKSDGGGGSSDTITPKTTVEHRAKGKEQRLRREAKETTKKARERYVKQLDYMFQYYHNLSIEEKKRRIERTIEARKKRKLNDENGVPRKRNVRKQLEPEFHFYCKHCDRDSHSEWAHNHHMKLVHPDQPLQGSFTTTPPTKTGQVAEKLPTSGKSPATAKPTSDDGKLEKQQEQQQIPRLAPSPVFAGAVVSLKFQSKPPASTSVTPTSFSNLEEAPLWENEWNTDEEDCLVF